MNFPAEPGWEVHRLDEPKERVRILRDDEAERLEQTARSDYGPFWQFLDESGFRLSEGLLRWSQVDWSGRQINTIGKGAKSISRPISDAMHEILWPLQGHHKEWVFTYIAKRTKGTRIKGQRYPLTVSGIKTEHRRMKDRAEVTNFRIHDRRHTFATELLRESNLRVVQKALNHSSTKTTEKYAHALNEDVREAMNRASRSRKKSHKSEREAG
jgi:integrase